MAVGMQAYGQESKEDWLQELTLTIAQSEKYDIEKLTKIEDIHKQFTLNADGDPYELCLKLFDEYANFKCDSAYNYAVQLQNIALKTDNAPRLAYAKIKLSFILLSSGMFKEAYDSLSNVNIQNLSGLQKAEYYTLLARYFYDLADYNKDTYYSPQYYSKAKNYLDSALVLYPVGSYEHNYYTGLQYIRERKLGKAEKYLKKLLRDTTLSKHQQAITTATLTDVYLRRAHVDTAINLLAKAAIADIQSATKETAAVFYLANLLFDQGDVNNASTFIQKAANDAHFYGSRQRKVQLSVLLPLIESQKSYEIEREKSKIVTYAIIITFFFLVLIVLIIVIVKQSQKSKKQRSIIYKKNRSLQNLLKEKDGLLTEKEWLLKEIHHRVKNNLQVVMSLLDSQADFLQDKAALSAIQESQHRVQAMALIHQQLYQSESIARIPMSSYIVEVVAYLSDSYSLYQPIGFDVEVEDIELDVTLAVPLGLIINEAITNAFKYAFPQGRAGRITVHLKRVEEASYQLMIADNGVGLPDNYDPSRSRSLGMTLIHGFSRQLGAKLTINSASGMYISLIFQEANLNPIYNKTSYAY
jgi:two-component sensor histidine kinase